MPTKDTFSYEDRWDSVGLSCGTCRHQANNREWPNKNRNYRCGLHDVPLRVELNPTGYIQGEWFCKDFEDNGESHASSVKHFMAIRETLPGNTLLGFYGSDGFLKEIPFSDLEKYG